MANGQFWNSPEGIQGLLSNPLLMAGVGLLSAGRDNRVDPYQMAMQGVMQSGQYQQQQDQAKMQKEMFDLQKAESQRKVDAQVRAQEARAQIQGLLSSGDMQGAAQAALASGDPTLTRFATGLLSPQSDATPADVKSTKAYMEGTPEYRDAYDKIHGRQQNAFGTFLPTYQGYIYGDQRSGSVTPVTLDGMPVIPFAADPRAQADVKRAQEYGKGVGQADAAPEIALAEKRTNAMTTAPTALKLLNDFEAAVQKQPATALGRGYEDLAGIVGAGNQEQQDAISEAETIASQLMAYAEKLPGPASDKDRIDFKASIGAYAKDGATKSQRLAAIRTAKRAYERTIQKYGQPAQQVGAQQSGDAAPNPATIQDLIKKYGG